MIEFGIRDPKMVYMHAEFGTLAIFHRGSSRGIIGWFFQTEHIDHRFTELAPSEWGWEYLSDLEPEFVPQMIIEEFYVGDTIQPSRCAMCNEWFDPNKDHKCDILIPNPILEWKPCPQCKMQVGGDYKCPETNCPMTPNMWDEELKKWDPVIPPHDSINHPQHYNQGKIEVIEFIEDQQLGFSLGNAIKYIARAGKKDKDKHIEDLKKAVWYVQREIEVLQAKKDERDPKRPNEMSK